MRRHILSLAALCLAAPAAHAQQLAAPGMPQQTAAPHPVNLAPPGPVQQEKLELLRHCIAQRDQLQRQIDQLVVETQTPEQMIVHLELLEVNLTAAEKLGIAPKAQETPAGTTTLNSWSGDDIAKLRSNDALQVLAAPKLEVANGEDARSQFGANANSELNGVESPYTDVQVRADALGNNRARVQFRVDRMTPDQDGRKKNDPAFRTQQSTVDSQVELAFDETISMGGLVMNRTRTRRGALGRVTETYKSEMVLLIRAEAVLPHASAIIPATAISPR
jgi:hypothetical protein